MKNEWSRYLKICEADKSKHLIPCYKDLDPEDMPKEFNHLQGADLGKMGAIQDILFNMEKYIPLKKQNTTVIQERVVVGGSGNNKIASLLDRGNMALEDGDWAKADSFFEDVLNNDSKNAQAYLGKTLATEKCRTIDAFARKRKDATQNVRGEKLSLSPNQSRIDSAVERFRLRGYVEDQAIRKLYTYDLSYHSDLAERQQQYRNEEKYWADHKWLSKAEKFAVGAVAEHLETEKKALFSALAQRVKQAEAAEAAAKKDVQARYEAHLLRADEKAEALFEDGRKRREADYQKLLMLAKNSADVAELTEAAGKFDDLGDYQDSKNLAGHCRNRAKEENERLLAKEKERHLEEVRLQKARIRRNRILALCAIGVLVTLTTLAYHVVTVIIPNNKYNSAIEMMANGEYEDAISVFSSLDGYSDSVNQIEICRTSILNEQYEDAIALFNAGSYTDAINAFTALNGYLDSKDWIEKCNLCIMDDNYNSALAMLDAGNYDAAFALLEELGDYKDSSEKILEYKYKVAETLSQNDRKYEAAILFGKIREYEDSWDQSMALWNEIAKRYTIGVSFHTVAVKSDGTALATGSNDYGQCDVGSWTDIVAICAGYHHTVGLKADGTVVAVGSNDCGQCDVSNWKDIVAISAGDDFTLGLKADGTVVAVGSNSDGECDVSEWTDVVAISAGEFHTVALKSDGTVVATGYNYGGLCDVDNWTDITAISASDCNTVGLRSDGTVVRVGDNDYHQQNVDTWTNIIAITTGSDYIFGLLPDGTVINTADDDFSNQRITKDWTDIVAISAGVTNTIGLKADGTVLVAGNNLLGTNNVSDWTNIKIP